MQGVATKKLQLINEAFAFLRQNWDRSSKHVPSRTGAASHQQSFEVVTLREKKTIVGKESGLLFSTRDINEPGGRVTVSVAHLDSDNKVITLEVGDVVKLDFGEYGSFQIRLLSIYYSLYPYSAADVAIREIGQRRHDE